MAFDVQAFSLGTAAQLIAHATFNPMRVLVHNHEHANNHDVYIGGSAVTASTGLHVPETETVEVFIAAGDLLWACANTSNVECRVFRAIL
jgi:hypothetical protein